MKFGPMEILMTYSPYGSTNSQTQILSSASNYCFGKSVSPWTPQTIVLPNYGYYWSTLTNSKKILNKEAVSHRKKAYL